jgi:hypothetical protein
MIDQNTIDALKAKHGDRLTLIECDGVEIVCKPVDIGTYRIFKRKASDDAARATAGEDLLFGVLVYPEREQLLSAVQGRPFLLEHFANEVVREAGALAEVRSKKL